MSRLDELKKQYPELNVTMFDVFKAMDPTSSYKYFPLLCKIFSKRWRMNEQYPKDEVPKVIMEYRTFLTNLGINTKGFSENQNYFVRYLMDFYPNSHFETLRDFVSLMENLSPCLIFNCASSSSVNLTQTSPVGSIVFLII